MKTISQKRIPCSMDGGSAWECVASRTSRVARLTIEFCFTHRPSTSGSRLGSSLYIFITFQGVTGFTETYSARAWLQRRTVIMTAYRQNNNIISPQQRCGSVATVSATDWRAAATEQQPTMRRCIMRDNTYNKNIHRRDNY